MAESCKNKVQLITNENLSYEKKVLKNDIIKSIKHDNNINHGRA